AGPYDASGDAAEACIGFHTNTGDPAAPVDFVRAGENRDKYYKHGFLGLLAEEADLARALKRAEHPVAEPFLLALRPDNAVVMQPGDVWLIREAVAALRVGINADYRLTGDHVLKWSVRRTDGGNVTTTAADAA